MGGVPVAEVVWARLVTRPASGTLAAVAEDAGIDVGREVDFTPDVLRHIVGTTLAREGTDIVETVVAMRSPASQTAEQRASDSPPTGRGGRGRFAENESSYRVNAVGEDYGGLTWLQEVELGQPCFVVAELRRRRARSG
jgi:hypothetical protein